MHGWMKISRGLLPCVLAYIIGETTNGLQERSNKMKKRFLATLMVGVMSITTLVGCGGATTEAPAKQEETTEVVAEATTEEATTEEVVEEHTYYTYNEAGNGCISNSDDTLIGVYEGDEVAGWYTFSTSLSLEKDNKGRSYISVSYYFYDPVCPLEAMKPIDENFTLAICVNDEYSRLNAKLDDIEFNDYELIDDPTCSGHKLVKRDDDNCCVVFRDVTEDLRDSLEEDGYETCYVGTMVYYVPDGIEYEDIQDCWVIPYMDNTPSDNVFVFSTYNSHFGNWGLFDMSDF